MSRLDRCFYSHVQVGIVKSSEIYCCILNHYVTIDIYLHILERILPVDVHTRKVKTKDTYRLDDDFTEVENRSDKLPSFMSSMTPSSVHYVRLPDGADTEAIEMFLLEKKQSDPLAASAPFKSFELQPYPDIHYDKN